MHQYKQRTMYTFCAYNNLCTNINNELCIHSVHIRAIRSIRAIYIYASARSP